MRAIEFLTEGDKMSSINLAQALANTPPVWKKFISSLPPQLAREFVDERPVPNQEDIDWFTPLRLKSPQPVAVSVADLLRHPENQGSIGRSPDDVIDAVNQQWGLKIPSGKKYDPNPSRYRAYSQMTPGTASPSVAVDGVIIFGAGRFVAAALRGDKTMRVWDMTREQGVAEGKITLSTDPNWYGATVDNYQASGPVVNIPANQLVGFEPDDKMNQPKSKVNVEKIVAGLKQGAKLPPLLVRKYKNGYQVLDGHHRFWAYKLLGVKSIPAQIVPDSDIEEISKQGVAEGIEDNYNKNDAGIKAALQAGVKLIPIQPNNDATGKPIYIHDYSGRYTVLVDMGGISVPYYVSTGLGGKAGVAVDKWYPFFGIGSDGWINKGSEATINDFYGSNKLKRVAQVLDNTLGLPSRAKNVTGWPVNRGDENYFISAVNRGLDPAPRSDHSTKIKDNMLSVLLRLGEPNKYVEKASPTQATRPKGIVFDKNNPEHVASFNATSQSERELATALAKEPKGVA